MKSFFDWVGGIFAAIALIAGRTLIGASYQRGIQYLTPHVVRFVGGAFLALLIMLVTVVTAAFFEWKTVIALTTILFPFVFLPFFALPAFSLPISAVIAGYDAAEEGDQANFRLVFDGLRKYFKGLCVVVVWVTIFMLTINFVPIGKSFVMTSALLALLIILLASFGTGLVPISPLLHRRIFYLAAWGILGGVVALFALAVPNEVYSRYGINFSAGVTNTEKIAYANEEKSKAIVDARGARNERIVTALMNCEVSTSKFTMRQHEKFEERCGKYVDPKGLTREEVKAYWPDFFADVSGVKEDIAHEEKFSTVVTRKWNKRVSEFGLLLVVVAIFVLLLILYRLAKYLFGAKTYVAVAKSVAISKTATTKKGSFGCSPFCIIAALTIGVALFALYTHFDDKTGSLPIASQNNRVDLGNGQYAAQWTSWVTLDGVCGPGRLGVEKECVNQWYTRETHASFRLEVTSNGRVLSGYLYSERDLPGRKEGNMVKELSIFLKTARS